ncbi:hypothetical protein LC55x_0905 [Lysobacter capsici]|nr:hypothetical protein LC55x_0905 [Lysobacter capsici]
MGGFENGAVGRSHQRCGCGCAWMIAWRWWRLMRARLRWCFDAVVVSWSRLAPLLQSLPARAAQAATALPRLRRRAQ